VHAQLPHLVQGNSSASPLPISATSTDSRCQAGHRPPPSLVTTTLVSCPRGLSVRTRKVLVAPAAAKHDLVEARTLAARQMMR
jgi:hypothetical protein